MVFLNGKGPLMAGLFFPLILFDKMDLGWLYSEHR